MNRIRWRTVAFFGAMSLFYLASCIAHPVTPTLIVDRQLDSSMFGVALAAMNMMNFLFSPFWGKLCGYVPTRRILFICSVGYALGQLFFALSYTEWAVMAGRLFAGIFVGGIFTAGSAYILNTAENGAVRGRNLTVMITLQSVLNAVGYFVGGMIGLISVEAAFYSQAALLLLAGVLFLAVCVNDRQGKPAPAQPLTLKAANPFAAFGAVRQFMTPMLAILFAVVALAGIGQNAFDHSFNYYIKDQLGLSSAYNGVFKAVIAGVSLLANMTLGLWLQRKTDTNLSFLPILAGCTLPLCLLFFFDSVVPFVIVDVVFFAFNAIRLPLLQNIAAARSTPESGSTVMGFYNSMHSLGAIFGALFAGLIYDANPMYPFVLAAAAFGAALLGGIVYAAKYKQEKA